MLFSQILVSLLPDFSLKHCRKNPSCCNSIYHTGTLVFLSGQDYGTEGFVKMCQVARCTGNLFLYYRARSRLEKRAKSNSVISMCCCDKFELKNLGLAIFYGARIINSLQITTLQVETDSTSLQTSYWNVKRMQKCLLTFYSYTSTN